MASTPPFANAGATTPDQVILAIAEAIRANDAERAAQLATSALALGLRHPLIHKARALALQQKGEYRDALAEFNQARAIAPADTHLMNAIGVCLLNLNQPFEAIQSFEQAIALDPRNAQAYFRKGWTLEMLGDRDESQKQYEAAVRLDPNHVDALGSLASIAAIAGRYEEARSLAERALRIDHRQPTAVAALGVVDLAFRDYSAAEKRFRSVLETAQLTLRARAIITGYLADALDGLGRYSEAFSSYRYEKNEKRKLYAQSYADQPRPSELADRIAAFVRTSEPERWISTADNGPPGSGARTHVFLVGFSRSGTTLLEQVLATHPDIVALEERDVLAEAAEAFLASDSQMHRLLLLPDSEVEAQRSKYWQRVRDAGIDVNGRVFVDKLPMNTLKLPLIAKLFPDAKILFALRDPRDVILSCYRRHFEINATMFEFLTLEDAVDLYNSVMELGVVCREKLPLSVHPHRYEDMVKDFDAAIRAVCEFVGIEWSDSMRAFHEKAVLPVRSPSAVQIRRPLNADSIGVWRHYREELAPILPRLRPWIERFGYPAE